MIVNMKDPKFVTLLELIDEDGFSMGAGKAQAALRGAGIEVSEPTAGRALRDLERDGLLVKNGSHGRKLTDSGRRYLAAYRKNKKSLELTKAFAKYMNPSEKAELIDILVARRAIEVEIARLAAPRISPEDVNRLRAIVSGIDFADQDGLSERDTEFHTIIADASCNNTLAAALKLIWHGGEFARKLVGIRYHAAQTVSEDHARIAEALASGDPDAAGRAMASHIDNVLRDVESVPEHLMEEGLNRVP